MLIINRPISIEYEKLWSVDIHYHSIYYQQIELAKKPQIFFPITDTMKVQLNIPEVKIFVEAKYH